MAEGTNNIMEQLKIALDKLGWNSDDVLEVNIGGVAFSGITQIEGVNPKWAKPYGTTSYQNDAFIVIKNVNRNPVIPSKAGENEKV